MSMNKKEHKKALEEMESLIASLRIALDIAIKNKRELEGVYPPAKKSKFATLSEEEKLQLMIKSFKRRKIPFPPS
jgi:hypothetical protein